VCDNSASSQVFSFNFSEQELELGSEEVEAIVDVEEASVEPNTTFALFSRACKTAIPVQVLVLLLLGVSSLVPICEESCLTAVLDQLSFPNGPPPT